LSRKNNRIYKKNYIYELFTISQYKTEMNLGKVIRLIFQSNFNFSLMNDCFYMSEILVNE